MEKQDVEIQEAHKSEQPQNEEEKKEVKKKRKISTPTFIIIVALVLVVIGTISFLMIKKTDQAVKVSPEQLISAYVENAATADERYKGKKLKIQGTIILTKNLGSHEYIVIRENQDPAQTPSIKVLFDTNVKNNVEHLVIGDTITVVGTCNGTLPSGEIELSDAIIEK